MVSSNDHPEDDILDEATLQAYECGDRVLSPAHFLALCEVLDKEPIVEARRALDRVHSDGDEHKPI